MIISPDNYLYQKDENGNNVYCFSHETAILAWQDARILLENECEKHANSNKDYSPYFYFMVGAPGSGKTTLANLIEKDFIGIDLPHIIFDATLTNKRARLKLIQSIKKYIKNPKIVYLVKITTLETCLERNKNRKDKPPIPEDVVITHHARLFDPKLEFEFHHLYDIFQDEVKQFGISIVYSGDGASK